MKRTLRTHINPRLRFVIDGGDEGGSDAEAPQPAATGTGEEPAPSDADDEDDLEGFDPKRALEKIRKLNSENRNLREAKKAAEEKAAGVDERDRRIKALEAENLRIRIGAKHGLPEELIDRLKGDTEEEILADAERLLALVVGRRPPTPRPKEALLGGTAPTVEVEETDPRKLAARIPRL